MPMHGICVYGERHNYLYRGGCMLHEDEDAKQYIEFIFKTFMVNTYVCMYGKL